MPSSLRLLLFAGLLVLSYSPPNASPLFDEASSLELMIEAPFRDLIRKRRDKIAYAAVVRYTDQAGTERTLHGQIMSRGNSRLDACDFPPLRLVLDESETAGTVFANQDRLKMVTQCKKSNKGKKWLLQELGIYRAYNIVSAYSYRTRRLDVTYVDSNSARWSRMQPAFFIEETSAVATRLKLDSLRPPTIKPEQFQQLELTINILLQFLIANTDFSVKRGPPGEGCCHNGRVLAPPGQQNNWIVLPYDFDQAGIINTDYALPDERFRIRSVKRRLYRGFCWHNDFLTEAIARFNGGREEITTALIPLELSAAQQSTLR